MGTTIKLWRSFGDQRKVGPWLAKSLDNLGALAHLRGDLAKADEYHRQALAIEEK
jgi:hypothetical protein